MTSKELQARIKALETVLEFYADKGNYSHDMKWIHGTVAHEGGRLARAALGQEVPEYVHGFVGTMTKRRYEVLGIKVRTQDDDYKHRAGIT